MKYLILGDLHWGHKNLKYLRSYFTDELFPYIIDNKIEYVMCLGDILDKRKTVDFNVLRDLKKFLSFFEDNRVYFYCLVGNHDTYYKNTSEVVGISSLCDGSEYIRIVDRPECIMGFDMIPWINDGNRDEILEFVKKSDSRYLLGHLELAGIDSSISGIKLMKGQIETSVLSKYRYVFSGHYHIPSEMGNIVYVGTPYELTFADAYRRKRFLVFDDETDEYEEVYSRIKLYEVYDIYRVEDFEDVVGRDFNRKYVKFVIKSGDISKERINYYLDRVCQNNGDLISIYVKPYEGEVDGIESVEEEGINILDTVVQYIDNDKDVVNKKQVLSIVKEIYKLVESSDDSF